MSSQGSYAANLTKKKPGHYHQWKPTHQYYELAITDKFMGADGADISLHAVWVEWVHTVSSTVHRLSSLEDTFTTLSWSMDTSLLFKKQGHYLCLVIEVLRHSGGMPYIRISSNTHARKQRGHIHAHLNYKIDAGHTALLQSGTRASEQDNENKAQTKQNNRWQTILRRQLSRKQLRRQWEKSDQSQCSWSELHIFLSGTAHNYSLCWW